MEYELADAGPCRKKLTLKFTAGDVDAAFEDSYREINNYVQIKGFRKGHAPRRALEKRFSSEAAATARDVLTEKHVKNVVDEAKLEVIGAITLRDKNSRPSAGVAYNMDIELDVMPEFDLPTYKGRTIAEQPIDVTDEAVDAALERYRKMFANYEPTEDPAGVGDMLRVNFVAKAGDAEIMNMADQRLRVEGDILFGLPCPELQDKFTGAKAGDTVSLTVDMPTDHPNPDLRGKPATIEVTVNAVEHGTLPELTDAFAESLGMGTIADFRQRVRGNLVREALVAANQKREDEIVDMLLADVSFDIPTDLAESETQALVDSRKAFMLRTGVADDAALKEQLEAYRSEAARTAGRKVRWGMLATRIAKEEGLEVTNDDMAAQVEALAQSYNTTPAKILQRIREFDGVASMRQEILSIKVVQLIADHAKGGRLDPDRPDADTESVNAAAAESVTKAAERVAAAAESAAKAGE